MTTGLLKNSTAAQLVEISVEDLEYNPDSPRLPMRMKGNASQAEIEEDIGRSEVIHSIVGSIIANGLLPHLPILVAPLPSGKFRVMDGTRRVIAVKAFTMPEVAKLLIPSVQKMIEETDIRPTTMYACVSDSVEAASKILGVSHLNNAIPWYGLPRTLYITDLFESLDGTTEERLMETSQRVGIKVTIVLRNINLLALHDHAKAKNFYGIEGLTGGDRFRMYKMWSLLGSAAVQEFIGMKTADGLVCFRSDPDKIKEEPVEEFFRWLFEEERRGSSSVIDTARKNAEEKLTAVLQYPDALKVLRETKNLDRAYSHTPESYESFRNYISNAMYELSRAETYANGMTYEAEDAGRLLADVEMAVFRVGQAAVRAKHSVTQTENEFYRDNPDPDPDHTI